MIEQAKWERWSMLELANKGSLGEEGGASPPQPRIPMAQFSNSKAQQVG